VLQKVFTKKICGHKIIQSAYEKKLSTQKNKVITKKIVDKNCWKKRSFCCNGSPVRLILRGLMTNIVYTLRSRLDGISCRNFPTKTQKVVKIWLLILIG